MLQPVCAKPESRIPELDGVRAVAIWMVMLMHVLFAFPNERGALRYIPRAIRQILGHGWLGVDLFFLLSGFLITGILLDTKNEPGYFRSFYIRRFLRIMPLYFVMVLVWTIFYRGYGSYFLLSSVFGANLASLLHIHVPHGPGVLWSLAVEEHFYLLWPLIVLRLDRRKILALSIAICIFCPLLRYIYALRGMNPEVIYSLSWFRFDGLVVGAIIALWARSTWCDPRSTRKIAAGLIGVLVALSLGGTNYGIFGTKTPVAVALRYTQAYLAFGAAFLLIYAYRGTRWTSFLRNRFMLISGALSFCLYLVHLSVGDAYQYFYDKGAVHLSPVVSTSIRVVVVLTTSFGVALVSRRYLEEPFLSLKDKLTPRSQAVSRATRAASATTDAPRLAS